MEILDTLPFVRSASFFATYIHVTLEENTENKPEYVEGRIIEIKNILSSESGINCDRIDKILPSLEDVFINLLEKGGEGV